MPGAADGTVDAAMSRHTVARAEDVAPGERVIVQLAGREVAVMNVDGDYHAVLNWCPHQAGPLCEGELSGTVDAAYDRETLTTALDWVREGYIVACPWHGWEFDVETGACLSDADARVPTYPVSVEDGELVVELA